MSVVPKQKISTLPYLRSLWQGGANDEARFLEDVRAMLGGGGLHCIPLGRARIGIYLLVKYAIREGRRRVILNPCTIPDVVNMVKLAGGIPIFVDYRERSTAIDLDQLSSLLTDEVACIIATHYHVVQAEMDAIGAVCRQRGVLLFEDCAVAFGATMGGKPVGGLTDASVFSFSAFKFLNFFWGGLITTRNDDLAAWLRAETATWPRLGYADYVGNSKNVSVYYFATRTPIFQAVTFPRLQRRAKAILGSVELPYERIENKVLDRTLQSIPSYAAFAGWRGKLGSVPAQIMHRRLIAALYRRYFGNIMVSAATPDAIVAGSCFVNFPIWVNAGKVDAVHRDAMIAGYDLGKSLYPNVHRLDAFADVHGFSAQADRLVKSTIYLPTHTGVSLAYAEQLVDVVTMLLRRHGAAAPAVTRCEPEGTHQLA